MNSSTTAGHARIRSAAPKSHTNRTESWAFPNAHDVISPAKTSLKHRKSGVRTKNWGNRTHQNQQPPSGRADPLPTPSPPGCMGWSQESRVLSWCSFPLATSFSCFALGLLVVAWLAHAPEVRVLSEQIFTCGVLANSLTLLCLFVNP